MASYTVEESVCQGNFLFQLFSKDISENRGSCPRGEGVGSSSSNDPKKCLSESHILGEAFKWGERNATDSATDSRFLIQLFHRHRLGKRIDGELQRLNCGHTRDGRQ
jgi:hypothetical protein